MFGCGGHPVRLSDFFVFPFRLSRPIILSTNVWSVWEVGDVIQSEAESLKDCLGPPFVLLFFFP